MTSTPKIDVHVHFLPPAYRQACIDNGHKNPDGMPYLPEWSEEAHLELMSKHNIQKSIVSISTPGTHLVADNAQLAAKVTRECNAYAADLKKRRPDHFGYWASLPIPDVDLCLKEIEHATVEGCDGFVMLTNGYGHYLGDSIFDQVFDELNRRKAILFIHPTTPCIRCDPELAELTNASIDKPTKATPFAGRVPNPMLEFLFDTTRAVSNLFLSGTVKRCPDIKFILPHLAGATPPVLSRWTIYSQLVPTSWDSISEDEVRAAFNRQFYFDLAGMPFPGQIVGLLKGSGVEHSRLMYGSDYPYTKAEAVDRLMPLMTTGMENMFTSDEIEDVYRRNAETLLRLRHDSSV
ncbi:hypothetical protein AMS68_006172 [Peltaster fructicola]|uniref:6-methylsalicylate decarboxylase n=1 Tax=Peltaster fructicola TaxID=286661 RepID=A0A6H0Y175_9PEZI|nr:hypothetical protein AMS68_006172 [Peltaster fructicola]